MILLNVVLLSFSYVTFCQKIVHKATKLGEGKIQYSGSVGITHESRLLYCIFACYENIKCLTFFYNANTNACVLHTKTFHYQDPDQIESGWTMYLIEDALSRCEYSNGGFVHYRELDLCYNFNPETVIDYPSTIIPLCASYGGKLIKIDSQEKQTYISYVLQGRPNDRVGIQGHSYNPGNVWTYEDGTPLIYTNWRSNAPKSGKWYMQIFQNDEWTEQNDVRTDGAKCVFICEIS